jgi:hypothetical protein
MWVGGGCTNENKRGSEEVRREGRWWRVCGRWRKGTRKGGLQISEEMKGIIIRRDRKLCWQDKRGTKSGFCRRQIGFLMRSGSKGKKEPWEMAYPIRRDATCTECVFETAVKPFHNPIGFWVKGCYGDVFNLQKGSEV